jgi:hypothetical protein
MFRVLAGKHLVASLLWAVVSAPPAVGTTIVLYRSPNSMQDDRERIQAALDAVEKDGGGTVHLTGGVYRIGLGGTHEGAFSDPTAASATCG